MANPMKCFHSTFLAMKNIQLLCSGRYYVTSIPQLNCSANFLQDTSSSRTTQKTRPFYCCRGVFTAPFHSNGSYVDHIEYPALVLSLARMLRTFLRNGRCLQSHSLATDLHVTLPVQHRVMRWNK
jgi:hypothetical protein